MCHCLKLRPIMVNSKLKRPENFGCIIFGVGEGILSETEIAHLNNSLAPFFCLNVENK